MIRFALALMSLTVALVVSADFTARAAEPGAQAAANSSAVIAIDVLLEPSADMARFAQAANKSVRRSYANGFTLGDDQPSHISLVHSYVRAGDLPRLEATIAAVLADDNPLEYPLTAVGYEHSSWGNLALMRIDIERSAHLSRVQAKLAEAVKPFAVPGGSADAFAVSREVPMIDRATVDNVENFIANSSGQNFKPHIIVGLAPESIAKDIEAIRFPRRTFRAAGVAIFQLGNYGTAQKELWTWKPAAAKR